MWHTVLEFIIYSYKVIVFLFFTAWLTPWKVAFIAVPLLVIVIAIFWSNTDCYKLGTCYSKSLPYLDRFVGREDDIHNITGYLDFIPAQMFG